MGNRPSAPEVNSGQAVNRLPSANQTTTMQDLSVFEIIPRVFIADFLRYFIAASAAYFIFWVVFIKQFEHRIIQKKKPEAKKMWMEFRYSMSTVVIFMIIGTGIFLAKQAGYTMFYEGIAERGLFWFFASIGVAILIHDAYFYWAHRLMHYPKVFKHVHLVHHRSTNPSPWAAYSFHPIEAVIEAGIFPLIIFTIPMHPLAMALVLVYMISRNVLGHLGIEFLPQWYMKIPFLNLHTTTTHHDLHHKNFNTNYGLYFTWWDRWFGTEDEKYLETFAEVTTRDKKKKEVKNGLAKKQLSELKPSEFTFFSAILLLVFSANINAQTVVGNWQTFHDESSEPLSLIEIKEENGQLEGHIKKIYAQTWKDGSPVCIKCKGECKGEKVIGMEFLWGFKKSSAWGSENSWSDGSILDPSSGEIYDCKIWLENANTLKVRGYTGPMNMLYRTQTWQLLEAKNDSNPIIGTWQTIDDESGQPKSVVEVFEKNGTLSGQVVEIHLQPWEGNDPVCIKCPDDLKNEKVVGMAILSDFHKNDNGKWAGGKIMDPSNGQTYNSTVWLEDENTLKVRGFLGPFFRTQEWKRADAANADVTKSP